MAFTIINQNRYPGSEFVEPEEIKPFVEVEGSVFLLVGYEDGDKDTPLVAQQPTNGSESLQATPLYELIKFTQGEIKQIEQST